MDALKNQRININTSNNSVSLRDSFNSSTSINNFKRKSLMKVKTINQYLDNVRHPGILKQQTFK